MTSPKKLPNIQTLLHESVLLKNNPMGDPHIRRLPVYLPPGYDAKRKDPYPLVLILSGWAGRGARYLNDDGPFCASLADRLDELIEKGQMPPLVVAFPDGSTKLGASQYINSPSNGPYMDYLCDEIIPFLESKFHLCQDARYRGVLGHSSGGFGALVLGMMRPDRFLNICSSAGDSAYDFLYVEPIPKMVNILRKIGGVEPFLRRFLGSPNPLGLFSRDEGETMMNLSMCACYAPNPSVPVLKGDVYFDLETGELIGEVWKKFLSWDPVLMIDRYISNLRKLRWIHLEAATEDEYALHLGHRRIARKFQSFEVPFTIDEYPGKHGGHHYRIPDRIRRMLERMHTQ